MNADTKKDPPTSQTPDTNQAPEKASPSMDGLAAQIRQNAAPSRRPGGGAPVHLWNPPYCGDLDIRIARDGQWFYLGTPIGREALVRLFASVLRHDEDERYYLVTPVEKIGITVEDVPFVAIDHQVSGEGAAQQVRFTTNTGDQITAGPDHPIRLGADPQDGASVPYIRVRGGLEARIDRKTYYRLVDLGEITQTEAGARFGLCSSGLFFPLASAEETAAML
ncbi:MAG: DUF1285 domain-containing protein [Neomegalonema sp.]|nr:DUF1285 domain-containing protein [Neomegalonema sp.]